MLPGNNLRNLAAALAAFALYALVFGVAVSGAKIVPQKGIAGAKMGMTQAKVRGKLGKPDRSRIRNNPFSGLDFLEDKYGKTWVSYDGTADSSEVWNLSTKDRKERTASGVGVGSTKREVKEGIKGVKCKKEFGINHCYVGEWLPFHVITNFELKKKRHKPAKVKRVGIGLVLD